jgi:tetratricopeptide (TPR) repeat protein
MGVAEREPSGRDFFVSYTQADRAWAEWIAWILEEDGHRVLVQAWDFVPGTNWIQSMQSGVRDATRTIAILSGAYLKSIYGSAEWQAAWASDPEGTNRKLLTVRVTECDRPGLLAGVVGVDLFGVPEAKSRARLRSMVSAAITGRAKPSAAPEFPGATRAMPREPRYPGALPQVWNVPARNPHFTGRDTELDEVARTLAAGATTTVHSVHGMGGVGKTQLATEYAYLHAGEYDLVWWIAAEEPAAIPDQFTALAGHLGLSPTTDPGLLRAQVHARLRGIPGWLLIFDNADEAEDIQPWLPTGLPATGTPGHVLITTRRGGFTSLGQVLDLDVIGLDDALALLRAHVPDLAQTAGENIARELGQLPLALEQAAAYMNRTQIPAQEYLNLLRSRADELYQRGRTPCRDTLATLWDISFERVGSQSPEAMQLLGVCAYLAPEPIPLDLFTNHADLLPDPLQSAAGDQLAFAETIAVLVDYSLMKRTAAGLQLHRLVQAIVRTRQDGSSAPIAGQMHHLRAPDRAAWKVIPVDHSLSVAVGLLRADAPMRIVSTPQDWPRWAVLLPHVLAATAHLSSGACGGQGAVRMADASWLLDRAGNFLRVHGRPSDARPLLERALTITEDTYGSNHPDVAANLNNLATTLRDLGQPAYAHPLLERTLAITEATNGPNHPDVATALNNLALTLRDLGHLADAQPLQERALTIDEATYGPSHPTVAIDLSNLALTLRDLGHLADAQPLQERALTIAEATYGPSHPTVAVVLSNLALTLRDLGHLAGAQPLQERALTIAEATYGPNHPDVAAHRNNLVLIMQDLGQAAGT